MNKHIRIKIIFVAYLILMLIITACGSKSNSPLANINTGPTQVVEIRVPLPEKPPTELELNLEFAAGELILSPGDSEYLASGTATFNAVDFEPRVVAAEPLYKLRVGDLKTDGISSCPDNITNRWDLQLADTPMILSIKAGAYEGSFELGGLSLLKLAISDTGSDFTGKFSEPNQIEMSSFTYNTRAGSTELKGLANANFAQMNFTSGAGDYTLSFDGDLQRDASVMIESRLSTVNIIIPEGVNAQVIFDGSLTAINVDHGWKQNGKIYAHDGRGPTISITVKMGTGTLNLTTE